MGEKKRDAFSMDRIKEDGVPLGSLPVAVCRCPYLFLALTCYWVWQLSFFQSPLAVFPGANRFAVVLFPVLLLGASALTYGFVWRQDERVAQWASRRWYLVAVGCCMAGGTLCQGVSFLTPTFFGGLLRAMGALLMGVGAALFVVEAGRLFAQLGPRYALLLGVAGVLAGAGLLLGISIVPWYGRVALLALMASGALIFLRFARDPFPRKRLFTWGFEANPHVPLKLAATCFVQGLALGLMLILGGDVGSAVGAPLLSAAAFVLGALLIFFTAGTFRMDFNHLLYQLGFPLMGLGFLVPVCLPGNTIAAGFLFTVAHCYVYVLMTCICSYFSNCLKCSPGWIVSLTTLCMVGGQALATLLAAACSTMGEAFGLGTAVSGTMAFAVPTVALLLLSNDNPVSGWGAMQPGVRREDGEDALFAKIASDYGLTSRETEITMYLARGRNKRVISQELGLAEETVKTHMGNVYRKLQVHSQQELIDLVEAERGARDR